MIGGNPKKGEVYGFAAFDAGVGTLALRNPSDKQRLFEGRLADLLDLSDAERLRLSTAGRVWGDEAAGRPATGHRPIANRTAPFRGGGL